MRVSKKYAMYHFFNLRINTIIKYYLIEIAKELQFSYVQYSQVFLVMLGDNSLYQQITLVI